MKTIPIPHKPTTQEPPELEARAAQNDMRNGTIFYGDDMLSRLKRYRNGREGESHNQNGNGRQHIGYSAEFLQNEPRGRFQPPTPDFEGMFSKLDIVSLKRAEAITKDILSNIPEQYREQAKKDLAQMPERMKESFNAFNELITNLAENPQAQNVVIQTIATAVKNDGLLGAMVKAMSLMQQTATKAASQEGFSAPESASEAQGAAEEPPVERKKKIKIRVE
jgi:hypothetical protein